MNRDLSKAKGGIYPKAEACFCVVKMKSHLAGKMGGGVGERYKNRTAKALQSTC